MVVHEMHLDSVPFNRIVSGSKTIELRLFDLKRRDLKVGDTIKFFNRQHKHKSVSVIVRGLFNFAFFSDAFRIFPNKFFGFKRLSLDQKVLKMRKFYSEFEELEFGVLAIWLKKL